MKTKKIFSLFLLVCMTLTSILFVEARDPKRNKQQLFKEEFFINQEFAIEDYKSIKDNIKKNRSEKENYGGAYIDKEGNLNVNIVNRNDRGQKIKKWIKSAKVKYHYVQYSLEHLEQYKKQLSDNMVELGINAVYVDEKNNKVIVHMDSLEKSNVDKIKEITNNSPSVEIKKSKLIITNMYTNKNIVNGHSIKTSIGTSSLGFGVKKDSDGKKGIVMSGHAGNVGDTVYYDNKVLGTIKSKYFNDGGKIDAAYVEIKEPSNILGIKWRITDLFYNGDYWDYDLADACSVPVGASVGKYGARTDYTSGVMLINSLDINTKEYKLSNAVIADYYSEQGDSGAPVVWNRFGGYHKALIGLHSAKMTMEDEDGVFEVAIFSNIKHIRDVLGVTPKTE